MQTSHSFVGGRVQRSPYNLRSSLQQAQVRCTRLSKRGGKGSRGLHVVHAEAVGAATQLFEVCKQGFLQSSNEILEQEHT